jgi:Cu-Zn family superoxide dismutase
MRLAIFVFLISLIAAARGAVVRKAVARITSPDGVDGLVSFTEESGGVHVIASISGLAVGQHGFHVHQYGDIRDLTTLSTLGYHFIYNCEFVANSSCEDDQTHGFPPSQVRHPGDMGNLDVLSPSTPATYDDVLGQQKMSLSDPLKSILGRAVLIHLGNDTGVQPYGNAGGPAASGVIGLLNTDDDNDPNEAVGPDVPPVDQLMCLLVGEDIRGEVLVTNKFSSPDLRVQFNISGLAEGDYTLSLHTYGDLTDPDGGSIGDVWSSDLPSSYAFSVGSNEDTVAYDRTWDTLDSLRDAIGRACALHAGDEEGDIVAVGVVGLAHVDAEIETHVPDVSAGSCISSLLSVSILSSILTLALHF